MTQTARRAILGIIGLLSFLALFYVPYLLINRERGVVVAAPVRPVEELIHQVEGAVVYQRPDGIYITSLGSDEERLLAEKATYPRFSPDGKYVAYISGRHIMRVQREGGAAERIVTLKKPPLALTYHPSLNEIYYSDGEVVRAVSIRSRALRKVITGYEVRELDLGKGGERMIATIKSVGFHIRAFDLPQHKEWKIANGCSASLSPDATLVTNNGADHKQLLLRDWQSGQVVKTIDAPPNHTFDNQYWSNHPDWIVSVNDDGDERNVFVHQISTNKVTKVTSSGNCDRPDLFVDRLVVPPAPDSTPQS